MKVPTDLLQARSLEAIDQWNLWRQAHPDVELHLSGVNLQSALLQRADLHGANLAGATLRDTHLYDANLRGANLQDAKLVGANLCKADLTDADLTGAILASSAMNEGTIVEGALFTGCNVYGIAAWGLIGEPRDQSNLVITLAGEPKISVDNLAVAQFIYLLVNNSTLRGVIDTLTSKVVLILGRFTPDRKLVLDRIKADLHQASGCVPVLFDFAITPVRTTLETVTLLARMARFIVADLSDAKSVLQELQAIVPTNPSVMVHPIIDESQSEPGMIDFFKPYPWFQPTIRYRTIDDLLPKLRAVVSTTARPLPGAGEKRLRRATPARPGRGTKNR